MKKNVVICILLFASGSTLFAQTPYDDIKNAFTTFSGDIATTLPYLSAIGLNWSDAYIGNFPHFAVGVTVGFTTIPYASIQNAAASLGADISSIGAAFQSIGFPLPTWCLDARLGGFGFPFDIGFKFGFLPQEAKVFLPENVSFDYLMVGGDFRLGILEENGPLPDISIGLGVTYLGGSVIVSGIIPGGSIDFDPYSTIDLTYSAGDFNFYWKALTLDLKAQISKNLVFITLNVGFGASYNIYAAAGGGFQATINNPQSEIDEIKALFPELDLSATNFIVTGTATGWALRVFGGLQFDLGPVKIDANGMYNLLSNGFGATVNLRVQL